MAKKSDFNTSRSVKDLQAEYGKMPPQAVDLEEAVLGALMLERDAFSIVGDLLEPDAFYKDAHQKIFRAIHKLFLNDDPVDLLTVSEALKQSGELEQVGGYYYLSQLTTRVASAAHIEFHAKIIVQKYLQRKLIGVCTELQEMAYDEATDVADLVDMAQKQVFEIAEGNIKKETTAINALIDEAIKGIEIAGKRADGLSGVPSGFNALDEVTSGWQPSDLVIIAARPAMGKTAFVLSMAKNMAVNHNTPVALFSLEMSNVQLVNRLIVNVCEIPGEKIKSGRLENYEWEQLDFKIKELYDAPIYVDDTPSLSVFELRTKARRLVREHGIKIIIIDYLQLMNASGMSFGSREQEVSTISRSLKGLAKELNIPIIALSQLNRGVEARQGAEGKRPQLADLRESGAIEQDADMVCFIHRPEYYKITEDERGNSLIGLAEIIIAKHRNGAVGDVRLRFKSEFAKFMNVDEDVPVREFSSNMNSSGPMETMPPIPPAGTDFLAPGNNEVPF